MKISKILPILLVTLCVVPSFGSDNAENGDSLYKFSATPSAVVVEAPKVAEVTKIDKKEPDIKIETKETKVEKKAEEVPAALVADAETLIKDKLVQKYQVRLDEVIGRMTSRLNTVSIEEQRVALTDLRDRMAEKKTSVLGMKELEPLKKDIIIAILDHVVYRLEGLIKQSAQTATDKVQV
jgi:hypothetical protein